MQNVACVFICFLNAPFWGEHYAKDNNSNKIKATFGIFYWLRGPKTHKRTYYYLCKHVIFLSNEPFTGSIMKQLALTQSKWTAESSHVYAARWKQMLRNPNTGVTHPGFSGETEGTLSQRHSCQLIDSIRKSWIPPVKHHYVRTTSNRAMANWPWMNPQIDFFFSSHKHANDKQLLLWLIYLDSKWMSAITHITYNNLCSFEKQLQSTASKITALIQHCHMLDCVQFH